MKSYDLLDEDQLDAIDRLYEYDSTLLIAGMGSGKTVISLSAIKELLEDGALEHVLIVAPIKVCKQVWAREADEWDHLQGMDVGLCVGTPAKRKKVLDARHKITVVNNENLVWLLDNTPNDYFDGLLIDEITKYKAVGGRAFKKLRHRVRHIKWRVGMTGTPVSEDWLGLFAMMLLIDLGETLGTNFAQFKRRFFYATDYNEYNWELLDGCDRIITQLLAPWLHVMPDYTHTLPPVRTSKLVLKLPDPVKLAMDEMRKQNFIVCDDSGRESVAETAATVSQKLMQIATGWTYDGEGEAIFIDDHRILASAKKIQSDVEEFGSVMVCYWYREDRDRLHEAFTRAGLVWADLGDNVEKNADLWNDGKLQVLTVHPLSCGHGLNLYNGGHVMHWYTPIWSRDVYAQTVARLWRRGQTKEVLVRRWVVKGTIDASVYDRVDGKKGHERQLKAQLEALGFEV